MKKNKIAVILTTLCLTFTTFSQAFAADIIDTSNADLSLKSFDIVKINQPFSTSELLENIGLVSYKLALRIDGQNYKLYPTFDDVDMAVENIGLQCRNILSGIEDEYQLEVFNTDSVMQYSEHWTSYLEKVSDSYFKGEIPKEEYEECMGQFDRLESFLDIYENDNSNWEIADTITELTKVNKKNVTKEVKQANIIEQLNELKVLLPYNTGGIEKIEEFKLQLAKSQIQPLSYSGNSSFNVTKGVTYATAKAEAPNILKYGSLSQDCTNFTSQIKHEGGVPFYKTASDSDGWNLKQNTTGTTTLPKFNYAPRWVNADKFVKFFGVKSSYSATSLGRYTAFTNFAAAIKKGSFIAYDKEADGSWNHNGFVTYLNHSNESTRRNISYHGSTYKDFKVAQHSTNYHAWTSSDKNGWETLPESNSKIVFAIVN